MKKKGRLQKIKEAYHQYKELRKDPRKKALMQLGAWIVGFFLFYVIAVVIMPHPTPHYHSSSSSNENLSALEKYQQVESFEYTMNFSYQGKEEMIEGIYFQQKYYFTYLGKSYIAFDDKVYEVDSENKLLKETTEMIPSLSTYELSQKNIASWLELAEKLEQREYKEGKIETRYQFQDIPFTVIEEEKQVTSVDLDLQKYLASKGTAYDSFHVTIEYKEMDAITSYESSYSDYQIVKGEQDVTN